MNKLETIMLEYIFYAIFGFIILNLVINLCLYIFCQKRNLKFLCWYWLSLLITFFLQSKAQNEVISIILTYGLNICPLILMSVILYETMEKKSPIKLFFICWTAGVTLTLLLAPYELSFFLTSIPITLAMAFAPLKAGSDLVFKKDHDPSPLQKFLGFLLMGASIHITNFSIFRMDEGAQLWGWILAFGMYQVFSVLLLALVLENQLRKEKQTLQRLVNQKTKELSESLKTKESLFRIVLHDIATPLQGQIFLISRLKKGIEMEEGQKLIHKLSNLTNIMKQIIEQVRTIETINSGKMNVQLSPVNLKNCLEEIKNIFEDQLKAKRLTLEIKSKISDETMFFAERTTFTTSVLGNLISNAIKFSPVDSKLVIVAREKENKVIIEVVDQGIGMPEEVAFNIFNPMKKNSRPGTLGETGTGFGMTQVKSFMEYFGGNIDVQSWSKENYPTGHGTTVTLTLEKSLAHLQ